MSTEIWKDIPGYGGRYKISDRGRIESLARAKAKILKPTIGKNSGYAYVILCAPDGTHTTHLVHRLVLLTFRGASNKQGKHVNEKRHDNRLENLEYKVDAEPAQKPAKKPTVRSKKRGPVKADEEVASTIAPVPDKKGPVKITAEIKSKVIALGSDPQNMTQQKIATALGIGKTTVNSILKAHRLALIAA